MKNIDKRKLGFRIRIIREEKNISREDLAARMNVSKSYIYRVESGRSGFTLDTLHKFAKALEVNISQFYNWEDQSDDLNKIKDSELSWREEYQLTGANIEILLTRLMDFLKQNKIELPVKTEKVSQERYIIELIMQLPPDLKKEIAQQILNETYFGSK